MSYDCTPDSFQSQNCISCIAYNEDCSRKTWAPIHRNHLNGSWEGNFCRKSSYRPNKPYALRYPPWEVLHNVIEGRAWVRDSERWDKTDEFFCIDFGCLRGGWWRMLSLYSGGPDILTEDSWLLERFLPWKLHSSAGKTHRNTFYVSTDPKILRLPDLYSWGRDADKFYKFMHSVLFLLSFIFLWRKYQWFWCLFCSFGQDVSSSVLLML